MDIANVKPYGRDHDGCILRANHRVKSFAEAALVALIVAAALTGIILGSAGLYSGLHHVSFKHVISGSDCLTAIFMNLVVMPFVISVAYRYFLTSYPRQHETEIEDSPMELSHGGQQINETVETANSSLNWSGLNSWEDYEVWVMDTNLQTSTNDDGDSVRSSSPLVLLTQDPDPSDMDDVEVERATPNRPDLIENDKALPIYEYFHEGENRWRPEPEGGAELRLDWEATTSL